jgi:hypothetical protein
MPNHKIDAVVDQRGMTQPPADPSVTIPSSVKAASAAADKIHQQAYAEPVTGDGNTPQPQPQVLAQPEPQVQPQAQVQPQPTAKPDPNAPPGSPEFEAHTYQSMKGRYDASQRQLGIAQQQLQALSTELVQTQALMEQVAKRGPVADPVLPAPTQKRVTEKDEETYGKELIDLATRAAEDAVAPKLTRLEQENQNLNARLRQTNLQNSRQTVHAALFGWNRNWEAINGSPEFVAWLRLPDLYSGQLRHTLLKAAFESGNAPRVIAFFQGFLTEHPPTGGPDPSLPQPGAAQLAPQPRQAAIPLEQLAAPGKAKPAPGNMPTQPAAQPIITRKYISDFYTLVRKGAFVGREPEKERLEREIYAAQNAGQVR